MKNYASNRVRNVVLLGHSGSGKTTYAEAALYYSGATKRFGKVEDGNTVADYEAEEIRRKVSINTSVIPVEWQDTKINFLDTPGYFDFAAEVKLAMNVADTGMIMVSAKSGVEVGICLPCDVRITDRTSLHTDLTVTVGDRVHVCIEVVGDVVVTLRTD